jgi:hypothetical protein
LRRENSLRAVDGIVYPEPLAKAHAKASDCGWAVRIHPCAEFAAQEIRRPWSDGIFSFGLISFDVVDRAAGATYTIPAHDAWGLLMMDRFEA